MELIISGGTIIIVAALASIINEFLPRVSGSYVAIAFGIAIGFIPFLNDLVVNFNTEIFMLFVVAPLLYFEGQATRLNLIWRQVRAIISLALVLALAITIAAGFSVHYLLGYSLPLAFIMASLATPTDATATEAVSDGLIVPERTEHALKLESMFNDASGIVLLSATSLWLTRGHLDVQGSIMSFIVAAGGGVVFGFLFAFGMISFRKLFTKNSTYNGQAILYLLTPIFIYLIAEHFHMSGIIAVVMAGLVQNSESSRSSFAHVKQFHTNLVLMNFTQALLNSAVFVILGLMLVRIFRAELGLVNLSISIATGALLYGINLLVRYLYKRFKHVSHHESLFFALGGVRGAITMALVFSIEESGLTSTQFNQVLLAEIFLILLSMIVPTVLFRFILPPATPPTEADATRDRIRLEMVQAGREAVKKIYLPPRVRQRVMYDLADQANRTSQRDFWQEWRRTSVSELTQGEKELEQRALTWALMQEWRYIDEISQKEELTDDIYRFYDEITLALSILMDPDNKLR